MSPRSLLVVLSLVVAASLVGAPLTMHDWGEQAEFSADPIEGVHDVPPVLQYESLSPAAQRAVRAAIEHGRMTVYGDEDFPEEFTYTDRIGPGHGKYIIVYEGERYELLTSGGWGSGVPLRYLLPFVGYGLLLSEVARQAGNGGTSVRTAGAFVGAGAAFHLLGPEFDFPLLGPARFSALGVVGFLVIGWWSIRDAL